MRATVTCGSPAQHAEADFISWRHDVLAHPAYALPFVSGRFDTGRFRPCDWDFIAPLRNSVPKRQAEFVAGRICAREALTGWGHDNVVVGIGAHREPIWPQGLLGSITHCADYAAAVVCYAFLTVNNIMTMVFLTDESYKQRK
jgi:hypothetical protein